MSNVTLWFDKDGVLAEYDYSLYEPENGAPAPWLVRNAHVFKNIEPYKNMAEAFSYLYKRNMNMSMYKRSMNVRVLTSVSDGLTLSEQVIDGAKWCEKYLGLRARDFYATAIPKENIPLNLKNEITLKDVLFDDYTPNLKKWKELGGTAVKVVNGINSTTTEFPYFYNHVEPAYIVAVVESIVSLLSKGERIPEGQFAPKKETVDALREELDKNVRK